MRATMTSHEEESSEHGRTAGVERLDAVIPTAFAGPGPAATAADVEHLACLLRLADAATSETAADCIR